MELTPTMILNLALLIVPPVALVLAFWQRLAQHIRWTFALTALCDVLLGITDTVTVFDDPAAFWNIKNSHLMFCGDLLSGGNGLRTVTDRDCDLLTGRNRI